MEKCGSVQDVFFAGLPASIACCLVLAQFQRRSVGRSWSCVEYTMSLVLPVRLVCRSVCQVTLLSMGLSVLQAVSVSMACLSVVLSGHLLMGLSPPPLPPPLSLSL